MPLRPSQPAHHSPSAGDLSHTRSHPARLFALVSTAAVLLVLPGCQSITGNPSLARLRVVDASPDAPGLDIYEGTTILAYDMGLGLQTSLIPITPGTFTVSANAAHSAQQLVTQPATFVAGSQYLVLIGNYSNSLSEQIILDQSVPAPSGQIDLRFIDQSTRGGALDLYLIPTGSTILTVKPILTGVGFGNNTGYISVPSGTYTLVAIPTGTVPTIAGSTSYSGPAVAYTSGSASTLVFIDQQVTTTPGVRVVTLTDYDPPGSA